jgi:predicted lipoprotein with Yx(FWY)xxD motif
MVLVAIERRGGIAMKHHLVVVAMAILTLSIVSTGANAQGLRASAATADDGHPADISSGKTNSGLAYTDSRGMTVYAMNMRFASFLAQGGNPLKYCTDECSKSWVAVKAAADAKPAGSWKVVEGAAGPQWSYKGDPVFTYVGDSAPGSAAGAEREDLFRLITYIPPMPKVTVPAPVKAVFVDEAYILEDGQGHALFTSGKSCGTECRAWTAFEAGMASGSIGDWAVSREGDHPQWLYRGLPVYVVNQEQQPTVAPAKATLLIVDDAPAKAGKAPARVAAQ